VKLARRATTGLVVLLAACASGPPTPEWQTEAKSSMDRAVAAYLGGDTRAANAELDRARGAIARTGRIDLLARAELMMCAAQVASLVLDPCVRFEVLRGDAAPAERAYADYLTGRVAPDAVPLLPPAQRAVATRSANEQGATAAVKDIDDPLSRLVGAGVLFRSGRANPAIFALAIDAASAQGWRRPLLAWLNVQRKRAERAGDTAAAERLRRQIDVIEQGGMPAK